MNQPGNTSIHAAGLVIVPKVDFRDGRQKNLFSLLPTKNVDGQIVTEWEGKYLDDLGYIKYDFLGLEQLDKFQRVTTLIEQNHGIKIGYNDIPLDEVGVFNLFKQGYTEDIFQFSGMGLSGYVKELQPDVIDDLIATVAIYRPGPMEVGAHKDFIERKNGRQDVKYDFGAEEITRSTYGLWVYQEQIMQACVSIASFSAADADGVRKAVGKMIPEDLAKYGELFISGAVKNGCSREEASSIWDKFKVFGMYAFNLSHSACYGVMGYMSQWFKFKYPLEFWTTSLEFSSPDKLPQKIVEINEGGQVRVAPVDINKSKFEFYPHPETGVIYWSLSSIKWVGDASVEHIMEERNKRGEFFTFEEFYDRVEKKYVNKRGMVNLILSGAFDEIERINDVKDRYRLILQFMELRKLQKENKNEKLTEDILEIKDWKDYEFLRRQKELTGLGSIDYISVIKQSKMRDKIGRYLPIQDLDYEGNVDKDKLVGGIITSVIERDSKKGKFAQVECENNSYAFYITIWNETYEDYKAKLLVGKILLFTGRVVTDNWKKKNVLHSSNTTVMEII